jgi:hypothetical protein
VGGIAFDEFGEASTRSSSSPESEPATPPSATRTRPSRIDDSVADLVAELAT